ncbi:MAG: protein translocase subunit SecF [Candidatus Zambryskibacteria bacterium]|nr:protein translocase subunit SecF [Candidatus Zambryskibacteria bacterium]
MTVIKYKKIWYALSMLLIAASFWAIHKYSFNLSTDFKGGTITEVSYTKRPEKDLLESNIKKLNLGGFSLRPSGEKNYIVRTKELSPEQIKELKEILEGNIERQNTIGPVAGAELQSKAVKAIMVVVLMIVLFVTFAFRKVSKPVASWKYGLATIIALAHDVIIPTGIFVFLGHEVDLLFVTGLLAILGYSVHDTIVVFDRVRENLRINEDKEFEATVGKSVSQTFTRSINTSVTILIMLLALYIFGSSATQAFSLLLIIGLIAGTYSSIFIASPLLVTFYKLQKNRPHPALS